MTVTTHTQTTEHETVTARVHRRGSNHALGHECQALCRLEGRTRGVLAHNTTIQQGLPGVL